MTNYIQLELFDLKAYEDQKPLTDHGKVTRFKGKPRMIESIQLELDLFSLQFDGAVKPMQAA